MALTNDQRDQELAAITPTEVAEFVARLAYWKAGEMNPGDITFHSYPVAEGRALGLAKRSLEAMLLWKQDVETKGGIQGLVDLLTAKLKAAVVDKEAGRVEFRFTGAELIALRAATGLLNEYDLTKQRDARSSGRGYGKGRR